MDLVATDDAVDGGVAEAGHIEFVAEDVDIDELIVGEGATYGFAVFAGAGDGKLSGVEPGVDYVEYFGFLVWERHMARLRFREGAGEGTVEDRGLVAEETLVNVIGGRVFTVADGNVDWGVIEFAAICQSIKESRL